MRLRAQDLKSIYLRRQLLASIELSSTSTSTPPAGSAFAGAPLGRRAASRDRAVKKGAGRPLAPLYKARCGFAAPANGAPAIRFRRNCAAAKVNGVVFFNKSITCHAGVTMGVTGSSQGIRGVVAHVWDKGKP